MPSSRAGLFVLFVLAALLALLYYGGVFSERSTTNLEGEVRVIEPAQTSPPIAGGAASEAAP